MLRLRIRFSRASIDELWFTSRHDSSIHPASTVARLPVAHFPGARLCANLGERLGYPPDTKLIIVHADDLGETHSVNAAAIKALQSGTINSASLMVPCPWFPEIADYAKSHPDADFGLHLTLTSERVYYRWGPVAPVDKVPSLVDETDISITTGKRTSTSTPRRSRSNCAPRSSARSRWAFAPRTSIRISTG